MSSTVHRCTVAPNDAGGWDMQRLFSSIRSLTIFSFHWEKNFDTLTFARGRRMPAWAYYSTAAPFAILLVKFTLNSSKSLQIKQHIFCTRPLFNCWLPWRKVPFSETPLPFWKPFYYSEDTFRHTARWGRCRTIADNQYNREAAS